MSKIVRSALVVAVVVVSALLGMSPASAHTELVSSSPRADASLAADPTEVRLKFTENLSKTFVTMTLARGSGAPVKVTVQVRGNVVSASVPAAGTDQSGAGTTRWRVAYRVVSKDSHPVTGSVRFSVRAAAATSPSASPSPSGTASAGADTGSTGAQATETTSSGATETSSNSWLATLVVGLIALVGAVGGMIWVARGRRQDSAR